jgi:hypothetical protein
MTMASLRSMILDGKRVWRDTYKDEAKYARLFHATQEALRSHDTILVNATSVAEDMVARDEDETMKNRRLIPCPKPPYAVMWLEFCNPEVARIGVLVKRTEMSTSKCDPTPLIIYTGPDLEHLGSEPVTTAVEMVQWFARTNKNYVECDGENHCWLSQDGMVQNSHYAPFKDPPESFQFTREDLRKEEFKDVLNDYQSLCLGEYWTLHAFARMNCHNVKLVPMTAGRPRIKPGHPRPPYSVWHEIVVTSLPQLRRAQAQPVAADGEKREIRFHKIRGHYADYTHGKGLFGKWKVRIWVDEYMAGNPELGTVVSDYIVK